MARAITGYIERRGGRPVFVRVTVPGVGRQRFPLPAGCTEALAEEKRKLCVELVRSGRLEGAAPSVPLPQKETFLEYAARWIEARKARGLANTKTDLHRLRTYVAPALPAAVPVAGITTDHVRGVVEHLDALVLEEALAWKTAKNIWGLVSKLFDDTAHAKAGALRVRDDNPASKVRGPDVGAEVASAYLFPREAHALLACETIPLVHRALYAVASYSGLRIGELRTLRVADVVLGGGYLTVHTAWSREKRAESTTKGKRARRVPIELGLRPLLEVLVEGRGGGEALLDVPAGLHSSTLRDQLLLAGVTRDELHAKRTKLRRPLAFHDLRHSFATWLALRGEPALVIQSRLGHADASTTAGYIAAAEELGRGDVGEPLGPLPEALVATRSGHRRFETRLFTAKTGLERRDSNPTTALSEQEIGSDSGVEATVLDAGGAAEGVVATSRGQFGEAIEGLRLSLRTAHLGKLRERLARVVVAANDVIEVWDRGAA